MFWRKIIEKTTDCPYNGYRGAGTAGSAGRCLWFRKETAWFWRVLLFD